LLRPARRQKFQDKTFEKNPTSEAAREIVAAICGIVIYSSSLHLTMAAMP
jgi:hypothetical protein